MSLYAEYIKERNNDSIVEVPEGFATYRYLNDGKSVYIIDIYIKPEFRQSHVASYLGDAISSEALALGAREMLGSVVPSLPNSDRNMKVLLAYGMKPCGIQDNMVIFRRDL